MASQDNAAQVVFHKGSLLGRNANVILPTYKRRNTNSLGSERDPILVQGALESVRDSIKKARLILFETERNQTSFLKRILSAFREQETIVLTGGRRSLDIVLADADAQGLAMMNWLPPHLPKISTQIVSRTSLMEVIVEPGFRGIIGIAQLCRK